MKKGKSLAFSVCYCTKIGGHKFYFSMYYKPIFSICFEACSVEYIYVTQSFGINCAGLNDNLLSINITFSVTFGIFEIMRGINVSWLQKIKHMFYNYHNHFESKLNRNEIKGLGLNKV